MIFDLVPIFSCHFAITLMGLRVIVQSRALLGAFKPKISSSFPNARQFRLSNRRANSVANSARKCLSFERVTRYQGSKGILREKSEQVPSQSGMSRSIMYAQFVSRGLGSGVSAKHAFKVEKNTRVAGISRATRCSLLRHGGGPVPNFNQPVMGRRFGLAGWDGLEFGARPECPVRVISDFILVRQATRRNIWYCGYRLALTRHNVKSGVTVDRDLVRVVWIAIGGAHAVSASGVNEFPYLYSIRRFHILLCTHLGGGSLSPSFPRAGASSACPKDIAPEHGKSRRPPPLGGATRTLDADGWAPAVVHRADDVVLIWARSGGLDAGIQIVQGRRAGISSGGHRRGRSQDQNFLI